MPSMNTVRRWCAGTNPTARSNDTHLSGDFMKHAIRAIAIVFACLSTGATAAELDGAQIDKLTGGKGTLNKDEGVYKVSFPRNDVKVTVDGAAMPPFMGLTSWAG